MRAGMHLWSNWKKISFLVFPWKYLQNFGSRFVLNENRPVEWMPCIAWITAPRGQPVVPTNQQKGQNPRCVQPGTTCVFWGQRHLQIRRPDRGRLSHFSGSVKQCPVRTKLLSSQTSKFISAHLRAMWKAGCCGFCNISLHVIHLITMVFGNWIFPVLWN